MRIHLSPHDAETIGQLRATDVLREVEGHRLNRQFGAMMTTCADGDQFADIFTKEAGLVASQCETARVHTFGWNGGALRLAVHGVRWRSLGRLFFRIARPIFGCLGVPIIDPFEEVDAAQRMKGIGMMAIYAHAPCGYAYAQGWGIETVIDRLFLAKDNLRQAVPGIKGACFVHVRYEDGRQRTYFVAKADWIRFRQTTAAQNQQAA